MKPPTPEGDAVAGPSAGASPGGGAAEPQSFGQHHLIWKAQQAKLRIHSVRNDWGGTPLSSFSASSYIKLFIQL